MAGGNPKAPENARSPRGLGLQLKTANGQIQHFALLTSARDKTI
jgi:catalase